jgi:hypothetical protein
MPNVLLSPHTELPGEDLNLNVTRRGLIIVELWIGYIFGQKLTREGVSMIRMAKQTRLKSEEIMARALEFFGENGEKIKKKDRSPCCIYFEGGGGYVAISIAEESKKRTLDIETREFEYQVKRFLKSL